MSKGNKGRACTMGKRWRAQSRLARRAFAFAGRVFVAQFRSRCNCTRFFVHPSPRVLCKTVSKDYADDHASRIKESHVKRKNSWTSKKTLLEEAALFFFFSFFVPLSRFKGTRSERNEFGFYFGGPTRKHMCACILALFVRVSFPLVIRFLVFNGDFQSCLRKGHD